MYLTEADLESLETPRQIKAWELIGEAVTFWDQVTADGRVPAQDVDVLRKMDDKALQTMPRAEIKKMVMSVYARAMYYYAGEDKSGCEDILRDLDRIFAVRKDLLVEGHQRTERLAEKLADYLLNHDTKGLLARIVTRAGVTNIEEEDKQTICELIGVLAELDGIVPPRIRFINDPKESGGVYKYGGWLELNVCNTIFLGIVDAALHEYSHEAFAQHSKQNSFMRGLFVMNEIHYRDPLKHGETIYQSQPCEEFCYYAQYCMMTAIIIAIGLETNRKNGRILNISLGEVLRGALDANKVPTTVSAHVINQIRTHTKAAPSPHTAMQNRLATLECTITR